MRKRSHSRECALKLLYQAEISRDDRGDSFEEYWRKAPADFLDEAPAVVRDFAFKLARSVLEHRADIDKLISEAAEHWDIGRMAMVDRNILRLGVSEILYFEDIPVKVSINEAIELAKKFGEAESSRFVNGVLDQIARRRPKPDREEGKVKGEGAV